MVRQKGFVPRHSFQSSACWDSKISSSSESTSPASVGENGLFLSINWVYVRRSICGRRVKYGFFVCSLTGMALRIECWVITIRKAAKTRDSGARVVVDDD